MIKGTSGFEGDGKQKATDVPERAAAGGNVFAPEIHARMESRKTT
jgi:hypothetical protein